VPTSQQKKANEKTHEGISAMLAEVLKEYRKSIYTSIPAVIVSYDGATKRASVQPTPRTAFKDGTKGAMPILPNVPVVTPAGGGFCIAVNLEEGDAVQVVFCQRGIKQFKKTFGLTDPSDGVLDINSPVIIAGFGGQTISPTSGISLQKEDGTVKVEVLEDSVVLETAQGSMILDAAGNVTCTGIVTALDFVFGVVPTSATTHTHSGSGQPPTPGT
jgi:hypothetical protein